MTAQIPNHLDSQHDDFVQEQPPSYAHTIRGVPEAWRLYGVIRGDPTGNNGSGTGPAYKADPGTPKSAMSSNFKGYVAKFQLTAAGRLVLLGFTYDCEPERQERVNEMLEGNFFMQLKRSFFARSLYVPFRDGILVADRAAWLCDASRVPGVSAKYSDFRAFDPEAPWIQAWLAFRLE